MNRLIVFLGLVILCFGPIYGQSPYSRVADQDLLIFRNRIWERNLKSGKFEPLKSYPLIPLPSSTIGRTETSWDGDNLYIIEKSAMTTIKTRYAFNLNSEDGPRWFWREPMNLSGNFRFLAAANRKILLMQEGLRNEQNVPIFKLVLWDLEDGSTRILIERDNLHGTLSASAILRNQNFIIMVNDGFIFEFDSVFSTMRELKSNFWPDLSSLYIQSTSGPKGETIYFSPHFRGGAFFDIAGAIYFPLQLREKNHWDNKALSLFWDDLKPSEQEWAIANGKWPPKEGSFDGSDEVAVILKFDFEKKELTKVPETEYSSFLEQDKYTHQWKWSANNTFSILGMNAHGQFVFIDSLMSEETIQKQ